MCATTTNGKSVISKRLSFLNWRRSGNFLNTQAAQRETGSEKNQSDDVLHGRHPVRILFRCHEARGVRKCLPARRRSHPICLDEGRSHWEGKLFVFDDRLVVPLNQEEAAPISSCLYCQEAVDVYYNCANMDCNELFVCCPSCAIEQSGCCCKGCQDSERVRPIREDANAKPFRKYSHEEKMRMRQCAESKC